MSDRTRQRLTAAIENALDDLELASVLMEDERDWSKVQKIAEMAEKLKTACFEWQMHINAVDPVKL